MAETKEIIIAVIGYIIALISPILGIIAGAIIFFKGGYQNQNAKQIFT